MKRERHVYRREEGETLVAPQLHAKLLHPETEIAANLEVFCVCVEERAERISRRKEEKKKKKEDETSEDEQEGRLSGERRGGVLMRLSSSYRKKRKTR